MGERGKAGANAWYYVTTVVDLAAGVNCGEVCETFQEGDRSVYA